WNCATRWSHSRARWATRPPSARPSRACFPTTTRASAYSASWASPPRTSWTPDPTKGIDPMTTTAAAVQTGSLAEAGILDRIIAETRLTPDDEAYDIAKRGVSAFIEELLKPQNENEPVKKAMVDRMIAEIDAKLSRQMDEILHHPEFQALESSWRGLKLLVDRTNFRENSKLEILNASKQDLLEDFEDSPEIVQSGLYKHIYTAEYGQFGG